MSSFARLLVFLVAAALARQHTLVLGQQFEGDICRLGANVFGECKKVPACDTAQQDIRNGKRPEVCSYEKDEAIVCCLNPSINWSPASSAVEPFWPSEPGALRPNQSNTQRPIQGGPQRPTDRPIQRPIQGVSQRPIQGSPQGPIDRPIQRPIQGLSQRPTQGVPQRPIDRPIQRPIQGVSQRPIPVESQRPIERPNQRPNQDGQQRPTQGVSQRPTAQGGPQRPTQGGSQRPNQRPMPGPTPLPEMTTQSLTGTKKKPQWSQIPKRKKTESPNDIQNPTTPMSEAFPPRQEMMEMNQLPNRVQEDLDKEGDRIAEAERVVFKEERGK